MKKISRKQNNNRYVTKLTAALVVFAVFFLSVGYCSNTASGRMENIMASYKPVAYARVTNTLLSTTEHGGLSNGEDYNINNVFGSVTLPSANSTVTYKVDVTVFLSAEMEIRSITGLNPNLEYVLTDYTLEEPLCDENDVCNYGATKSFYITIKYKDGCYDSSNVDYPFNLNFTFERINKVAKIGKVYFDSLEEAVGAVLPDGNETTVVLLKDTSENINISTGQNVKFDLQRFTVSNSGNKPVINNEGGTVTISNGVISSDASTQGAVNNNTATSTMYITGGTFICTGGRQALYNKGTLSISGDPYFRNTSSVRAAVDNTGGTVSITGGTIESENYSGLKNTGSLVIGTQGGEVSDSNPSISGKEYGVNTSVDFYFYDGIMKGKNLAVYKNTNVKGLEEGYELCNYEELAEGGNYKTMFLGHSATVTFNYAGGKSTEASRNTPVNRPINSLPKTVRTGYTFVGWFDSSGNEVTIETIITGDVAFTAHWIKENVCEYNGNIYGSVQEAINAVPKNGTLGTITLLKDSSDAAVVSSAHNIVLDLDNHTLTAALDDKAIDNNGTLLIKNGTMTSDSLTTAVIDNENGGNLTIQDMTITQTGTGGRQAIYGYETSHITITGDSYLSSNASGTRDKGDYLPRGTIDVLGTSSTITITGGTIVCTIQSAITSYGGLIIGTEGGTLSANNPVIQGRTYGVNTRGTINFYDGIIKGVDDPTSKTIDVIESGTSPVNGTEVIGGNTYKTVHLN